MVVDLRLFGVLRERARAGSVQIEIDDGATVRDALEAAARQPGLGDSLERMKVVMAVNREYADPDAVLHEGDELALIPPVSGGATAARPEAKTLWGKRFWEAVDGTRPGPPCAELLGWRALEMEAGRSRIEFEAKPEFLNPVGAVQGGFLAAMLDDTMGPAAVAAHGGDVFTPTLELKASFLRPAFPGKLIAEGRVVRMGRSIVFLEGSLRDSDDRVVATATSTSRVRAVDPDLAPGAGDAYDYVAPPVDGDDEIAPSFMELVVEKAGGGKPAYIELLGERPLSAEPGAARIEFHASADLLNPNGAIQGGFLAAMLDETMGPAGFTLLDQGYVVPTIELKTSFLAPARPGRLVCEARVVHKGGSVVFTEATLRDEQGPVAAATGSALIVPIKQLRADG